MCVPSYNRMKLIFPKKDEGTIIKILRQLRVFFIEPSLFNRVSLTGKSNFKFYLKTKVELVSRSF